MANRAWTFNVETKESGQRQKYGDSYYHYIVESNLELYMIEAFCKKVLKPAMSYNRYKEELPESFDNNFRNYYTEYKVLHKASFSDKELNKVEYKVVSPSTH